MQILIDTNVLLRSIEPGHPHHEISASAIDTLRQRGHELVVVPQVLYEFWSVATRPLSNNGLGMNSADALQEIESIRNLFQFLHDERGVYQIWERIVSTYGVQGKKSHDARLAAALQRHNFTHLLTFNAADFARYAFMTTVTPDEVNSGSVAL